MAGVGMLPLPHGQTFFGMPRALRVEGTRTPVFAVRGRVLRALRRILAARRWLETINDVYRGDMKKNEGVKPRPQPSSGVSISVTLCTASAASFSAAEPRTGEAWCTHRNLVEPT
jgi:hypothetical protein